MKKIALTALLLTGTLAFAQDRIVSFRELPAPGQRFITKYFDAKQVSLVKLDDDILTKDYEVLLSDGTKIEFDADGNWKEVDGKYVVISGAFIPSSISGYVKGNFPNTGIVKVEKERFGYNVELNNDLELDFDSKGAFVRIDD